MKIWVTIVLTATVLTSYGQVNRTVILGEWICENNDSLYYTNKYVTFYSDSSFKKISNQCDFIAWTIKPDKFMFVNINKCGNDEQTRLSFSLLKYGIDVRRQGRKRIIELRKGEEVYDRFKVIQLEEHRVDGNSRKIKILKLKRV